MDLSCDPEIICVFCGLEFSSVENVELHIHHNHQSNHIDQIENKKPCVIDDYADQTQSDGSFFMLKEIKEINLIEVQKESKSDDSSQVPNKFNRSKIMENTDLQFDRKANKLSNLIQTDSDQLKETGFHLENNIVRNHRASTMLNISETIANLVDNKIEKVVKKSLRCQNCDKQFTLSNNLSRHRRLYCSSLRENNIHNNGSHSCSVESINVISSNNHKFSMINKPGNISKATYENDSFLVKKGVVRRKLGKTTCLKHKCPKCFKQFLFKITQMLHIQNHQVNDNQKWNCEKCGFRYSKKQILIHHYERKCGVNYSENSCFNSDNQSPTELLQCSFCQMIFSEPLYFEMHQYRICQRLVNKNQITQMTKSDKSMIRSINESEKNLEVTCGNSKDKNNKDLSISKALSSKSGSTDQSISENFENEFSPRSPENTVNGLTKTDSTTNLNQKFHWHNYDENQHKCFQCDVCKKSFSSRSSLSNHIKSHYSSRGQPFTCRDCNRRFVNLLSLQDHRREMCSQKSNDSDQKIIYSLSNFNGVSQVPIWPNITNTNSGNQPVTCLHCSGVFYDRLELEEHALSKHSNEQGNILCLLCDRSFTTNMALRVHLTKSHGFANGGCPGVSQNLPPMPKLETNYHIGNEFPTKKRRKDKRLYELDKEYACDNCHRNFSTGQALGNHKRACLNLPNECISVEPKPPSQNPKSNSKLHSIESLIFDNTNIRSTFTNDKNVFLAFN